MNPPIHPPVHVYSPERHVHCSYVQCSEQDQYGGRDNPPNAMHAMRLRSMRYLSSQLWHRRHGSSASKRHRDQIAMLSLCYNKSPTHPILSLLSSLILAYSSRSLRTYICMSSFLSTLFAHA